MAAPKYKFTYYNSQGLGEPIRFMFVLADEPFIDNRIELDSESFENVKPDCFWEKLPVLEVEGGIKISYTLSIARFLARRFGIVGKNDMEATSCDEVIEALSEFRTEWLVWANAAGENKSELLDKLLNCHVPHYFKKLDKMTKKNVTGNGWIVGESVTWADLYIAYFMVTFNEITKSDVLNNYKHLKGITSRVFQFPAIAEYVSTRPDSTACLD